MKPRKRIVLYGGSELTQSILRVVLDSKGCYRVDMEMSYLAPDAFLLIDFSSAEMEAFETQRWLTCRRSRVIAVREAALNPALGGMAELMERLRVATFRKRGPKQNKGTWRVAA